MADGRWSADQDILAYFTRPTRSINHRAIAEIRSAAKHAAIKAAEPDELSLFLAVWPDIDSETGLSKRGDELLIKAREAMIAAVHTFNSAGLTFRAELFIVTAVIAWTYLLHAWFKRAGIDYRYMKNVDGARVVETTTNGAEKYWELSQCLRHARCPIERGAIDNLQFLIEIRHEIEHRSTNRIDDALSAKLQACAINFNDEIKKHFGAHFGLERRLPIALQFITYSADQRAILKRGSDLPRHIETTMEAFEKRLTPEQQSDPRYSHRIHVMRATANRPGGADLAVQLIDPASELGQRIEIALKEVEKKKYLPKQIVRIMRAEGYRSFSMQSHTTLWQRLGAKDPAKGYGAVAVGTQWCWYETWLKRVRDECAANAAAYGFVAVHASPQVAEEKLADQA